MDHSHHWCLSVAVAVLAGAATLTASSPAEACSPIAEQVRWTIPEPGAETVGTTPVFVAVGGRALDGEVRIENHRGDSVASTDGLRRMAGVFSHVYEVTPDEPLEQGDYTLVVEYPDEPDREGYESKFSVDASAEADGPPGPVDFRWYRETYERAAGDTCYGTDEFNVVDVRTFDESTRLLHLEFFDDGDRLGFEYVRPERADLRVLDRFEVRGVDCIRVTGIDEAGLRGDVVEHCEPDKCTHYGGDVHHGVVGRTDWNEVSGCDLESVDEQSDDRTRGCQTSPGGPAVPALAVLLLIRGLRSR